MIARWRRRRAQRDRSPWGFEELSRLKSEQVAWRRRQGRARRQMRRLVARLPW